jgi:hypothetical protein
MSTIELTTEKKEEMIQGIYAKILTGDLPPLDQIPFVETDTSVFKDSKLQALLHEDLSKQTDADLLAIWDEMEKY